MLHPDRLDHADKSSDDHGLCGWAVLPLTMVIGQHGISDFDRSLAVLREMTMRFSSEFGVRYFLLEDQSRALAVMREWVGDPNRHVRRLVSEGTRPRLPWAMRLPALVDDPSPVMPLLEALRDDAEPYVRRSVANHLNDISKDHPAMIAAIAARWSIGADVACMALLRHACRTLVKRGDVGTLSTFGYGPPEIEVDLPRLSPAQVRMGETIELSVAVRSLASEPQRLQIDYRLHLLKAGGDRRPKVFKGGVMVVAPGEAKTFGRRHAFREVTTRRHYPGVQGVSFRINGQDTPEVQFVLLPPAGS